jgi:hypothetical protein
MPAIVIVLLFQIVFLLAIIGTILVPILSLGCAFWKRDRNESDAWGSAHHHSNLREPSREISHLESNTQRIEHPFSRMSFRG